MTVKEKQKIRIDTIEIAEKALFGSSSGQDSFDSSQSEESSVKLSALEIALRDIGIGNARAFSTQIYTINGAELNDTELLKAGELLHHDVTQDAFFNEKLATERIWDFAIRVDYKPGVTDNAARVLKKDLSLIGITESDVYTSAVHYVKGDFNQTNSGLRDELERLASNPQIHNIAIITKEEFEKNNGFDKTINPVILPDRPNMFYVNVGAMDEAELILTGKDGTLNTNIEQNPKQERGGTLSLALDYLLEIQKYSNSELNMQSARTKENKGRLTDTELEVLAQMWSEHCRHSLYNASIKESDKGIFDHYIRQPTLKILEKKPHLGVSIYKDNSGVFRFNDKWLISIKNETHNSPSALDPYGGAITGIVGVNRDLAGTGMGAEVIANFLFYFLGHPEDKQKYFKRFEKFDVNNEKFQKEFINPDRVIYGEDKETIKGLLEELLLNPKQIFDGVVKGVEEGGNQMGIPINMGTINYHKRYNGKPIVGVGSIGRMPIKIGELYSHEKHIDLDDRLYICGGRAGIDGIHGATFSSEGLTAKSPATAVQIGDPYTQRKLFEALLEARDKGIINFITDLGAGGVSCAALEMAEETNGLDINLDKLLVKYEGMTATELFLNESQERMAIALNPKYAAQFEEILKKHEVEYSDIGSFTNSGRAIVKSKDEVVVDMDMHFINNGFPKRTLNPKEYRLNEEYAANLELLFELRRNNVYIKNIEGNKFAKHEFYEMHKRPNLASIASFMDKMDSTVKGLSVQHCIQGKGRVSGRASCTLPDTESKEALIQAYGHAERQSYIDAERMGINSFLRSIGNNIAMGGRLDYMVATDQALWQNSDKPEYQQMLIEGNRGLSKVIEGCEVPVISGKDSMYNQAKIYDKNGNVVERGVFPTILMTTLSKIDDVDKLVTIDAKNEGDVIYIIGSKTKADMGGSEFMNMYSEKHNVEFHIGKTSDEKISEVYETFKKINKAADEQLLQSAIYVESGGIMIALRDMAMSGEIGIKADLSKVHHDYKIEQHELMYGETEGRFIVTVKPQDCEKFEKSVGLFADKSSNSEYGCRKIGFVGGKTLDIEHNNRTILSEKVDDILATYHQKTEEQPKIAA